MSQFDPNTFMNTRYGEVSERTIPLPADEYLAQVSKVSASSGKIGKGERIGQDWHRLDIQFDPSVDPKAIEACKAVGLNGVPKVRYGLMLNLDENGKLLTGDNDNPRLGKLLTALGVENDWSPSELAGRTCIVKVKHNVNAESGEPYAEVDSCVSAG